MYRLNLTSVALPVPEIIAIEVLVGVANRNIEEQQAVGVGNGTVRNLVSSYRPSIVTFPLYFRSTQPSIPTG